MKRCFRCGIERKREDFLRAGHHKDGLSSHCRACDNAQNRTPEERAKRRAWYHKNRDRMIAKQNEYAAKNRAREAARARAWRKANPGRLRELNRSYTVRNRAAILEQKRVYAKLRPEILQHNIRKRKARVRGAVIMPFTAADWLQTLIRHNHACAYCGRTDLPLSQEHDVPISRGGLHAIGNVVPACQPCNNAKYTMTGAQFRSSLIAQGELGRVA